MFNIFQEEGLNAYDLLILNQLEIQDIVDKVRKNKITKKEGYIKLQKIIPKDEVDKIWRREFE